MFGRKQKEISIGKLIKQRSIITTLLRVLLGMFIVTFLLTTLVLGYVYFIRRDRTINKVITTETINDDTISKEEAERRNLDNVLQTPVDIKSLTNYTNVTISQDVSKTGVVTAKAYEITKDLKVTSLPILQSYKTNEQFVPIFTFKLETLTNELDINALSSLILTELTNRPFKTIYLDTTFTYIKDFNTLAANLRNSLVSKNVKVGMYLYPKWGKEVNYNDFLQVSNQYHKSMSLSDVVNAFDEVVIELYGFSNEFSILPANIAPVDWAKRVVTYTAQEVTDRSKILFEINSNYYIWPEKEFADDVKQNYSVLDPQAEIMNNALFDSKGFTESSTNKLSNTYEIIKTLELSGKKFISISPSQDNIDKLIALTASYGFKGYIIK